MSCVLSVCPSNTHSLQILPRLLDPPGFARQVGNAIAVLARLPPAQRSRSWHLVSLAHVRDAFLERRQQRLHRLGRQVLVVVVVDLDHGRVDAGAEALDLDEGEEAVGGGLALLDAQVLLYGLYDGVASAAA